ncbi:uncharacterized protein LOC144134451 [Amblyomma americanum]
MDMGTDPCDDFYLFSCGAADLTVTSRSSLEPRERILSKVRAVLANWALEYRTPTQLQSSASLYQGCISVVKDRIKGVEPLVHFLRKQKMDIAKDYAFAEPLGLILKLAVRYNINTLFELAVEKQLLGVRRRLALHEWSLKRLVLIRNRTYDDYMANTFSLLGFTPAARIKVTIRSIWHTEDVVLRLFSKMKKDEEILVFFNLTERGILDRPEWKANLKRFWDRVVVKGPSVAAFVNRIFGEVTPMSITQYVFWEVVRQLGPFTDFRFRMPSESQADTEERCFRAVYAVTGLAPLAVVMAQDVSSDSVTSAAMFLNRLLGNMGASDVTIRLLDPRQLLEDDLTTAAPTADAEEIHTNASFLTSYLKALMASKQRELDSLESPQPVLTKEYVLSTRAIVEDRHVTVPTSLLTKPWFSPEFPRAFNYAGLGFAVVEEMIRAGIRLYVERVELVWMPWTRLPKTPARCKYPSNSSSKALELLLQALNMDDDEEHNQFLLPGTLESFSEEQLFFLAICSRGCEHNDTASRCNSVLRSMWHFGKTFECLEGEYMNPRNVSRCAPRPPAGLRSLFTGAHVRSAVQSLLKRVPTNGTLRYLSSLLKQQN